MPTPTPPQLRCQGCHAAFELDREQPDDAPSLCPRCECFPIVDVRARRGFRILTGLPRAKRRSLSRHTGQAAGGNDRDIADLLPSVGKAIADVRMLVAIFLGLFILDRVLTIIAAF